MKIKGVHRISYYYLLMPILVLCAPFYSISQNTFNKTFSFQNHREEIGEIIEINNEYFFIGGSREENSSNNNSKIIIIKTDRNGIFLDSLNYQFDTLGYGLGYNANSVIYMDSILYISSVFKYQNSTNIQDGCIVKIKDFINNPTFNLYPLDSGEVFMSLLPKNNDFVVIGQTNTFGSGRADYYLLQTDTAGNIYGDTTYGGALFEQIGNGLKVNDNQFVFGGKTSSEANPRPYFLNPASNAQFIAVDSNFNEIWNTVLYSPGIDRVPMIKEFGFFHYYIEHPILPPPIYLDDFVGLVGQIDLNNGSLLWLDTVRLKEEITAPKFMETVDSSSFVIFAEVESPDLPYNYAKIIKYNNQGQIVWQRSYYEGNHNGCHLNTMIVDDDGFLVFGGTLANLETQSQDAWLLKLRPDGCLSDADCGLVTGIIDLTPGKSVFGIRVFPNPVKDVAHILVEFTANHKHEELELQIFDINGKLVYSEVQLLQGQIPQFSVDVSAYPSGTYFVQACIEGKECGSSKLVVE